MTGTHTLTSSPSSTVRPLASEQYHGDLRKGAYLCRRAEYRSRLNAAQVETAHSLEKTD